MQEREIPTGWIRNVLDPCLMALLSNGEAYGYQLAGHLEEAGLGRVPGGSLYPSLLRLEKQGYLSAEWRAGDGGPGRKYYALTPAGRKALTEVAADWISFAQRVTTVLEQGARL